MNYRTFRSMPLSAKLLVINQFGVNVGFYMLVPYLAVYLTEDVGLSLALVAAVLAVRNLSQQGLFLVGGTAADRLGPRNVIIAGCALRAVGFGLFAIGDGLPLLLAGAALSGFAGALFNPAVRAYLSDTSAAHRVANFAVFNAFANAGALVGPLVGTALLVADFRLVATVAAALFAALTVAQLCALPRRDVTPTGASILGDWRTVVTDRPFVIFAVVLSAMYTLCNQLYLLIPVKAGGGVAVAVIFGAATVISIVGQVRITAWCTRHLTAQQAMTAGLAVMGAAFLFPWPIVAAVVMSLGYLVAQPFVMDHIGASARPGLSGTYFGLFYAVSGVAAALGSTVIGWAASASVLGAWLLCAAIGLGAAVALRRIRLEVNV